MPISPAQIDEINKEIKQYSQQHLGTKNGPDFAELAEALIHSKTFNTVNILATTTAILIPLMVPPEPTQDSMKKMLDESPLRTILADLFYLGYQLGRKTAESHILEELALKEGDS